MKLRLPRALRRPAVLVPVIVGAVALIVGALALGPRPQRITDTSATAGCSVDYTLTSQWPGGFTATITITNLGSPLTRWNLRYRSSGNQTLTQGWNGTWAQRGSQVTVTSASWNGRLGAGASAQVGANFRYSGSNAPPAAVRLNGARCTGRASAPRTATSPSPAPPSATLKPTATASPTATALPPAATAAGRAPQLHVSGNELVSASGRRVVLHGVDRSGTEFACVQGWGIFDGPSDQASIDAMKSFGINAVRIPLNEACWNGQSYVKAAYAGATYRSAITSYVRRLNRSGMVAILDLHWTDGRYTGNSSACASARATCQKPMPDAAQSVPFWTSVARTFAGNNAVVFDLFNEPFPERAAGGSDTAGWQCWRNGGSACAGISYPVAGMQALVDAVRSTGARNVLMLGGLEYANDLTQWLSHEPADPDHNLAASLHSYNFNACDTRSCWTSQLAPVIARVPVIAGEIGENNCADTYIDPLMSWLDSEKTSYLAWTWNADFNCSGGPGLITSYSGSPTAYGAGYESHLRSLAGG